MHICGVKYANGDLHALTPIHPYTDHTHWYAHTDTVTQSLSHTQHGARTHMHSALTLHSERAMTVVMTLSRRGRVKVSVWARAKVVARVSEQG